MNRYASHGNLGNHLKRSHFPASSRLHDEPILESHRLDITPSSEQMRASALLQSLPATHHGTAQATQDRSYLPTLLLKEKKKKKCSSGKKAQRSRQGEGQRQAARGRTHLHLQHDFVEKYAIHQRQVFLQAVAILFC